MGRVGVWLGVVVLLVSAPAAAEDRAAARQAYLEGSKHYDLNQFPEALEAFKRAYWNHEDPVILYNIAQCHRALGNKQDAIQFYRSYLRKLPAAKNRDEVTKIMASLESAVAEERKLATAPPQGTITTEAKPAALPPSPAPQALAPVAAPVAAPTSARPEPPVKPARSRAWIWGVVAGVVAAGVVVGVGVGVGLQSHPPSAADGSVKF